MEVFEHKIIHFANGLKLTSCLNIFSLQWKMHGLNIKMNHERALLLFASENFKNVYFYIHVHGHISIITIIFRVKENISYFYK